MTKSILQDDTTKCYICGMSAGADPLDCHHVFGASNRNNSEMYGLKVYLHHNKCHVFGKNAVHQNAKINNALKAVAQQVAMTYYGWTVDDFRNIFGKNYT